MIGIRMIFKTRIKLNHLLAKFSSKFKDMWRLFNWSTTPCSRKCFAHSNHYFSMLFFNSKIGQKHFCNIRENISTHIKIEGKMISTFHAIFVIFGNISSKCFTNPFKDLSTIVRNFKHAVIIGIPITCSFGNIDMMANEKTAFPVNESSQISQIQRCNFGQIIRFKFGHKFPFVINTSIIDENNNYIYYVERLSVKTSEMMKRQSELIGNYEREIRRVFPAIVIWSVGIAKPKVTECLNESARLLAQNMAQTMDEVTRDVLASTSSVLQCSNGTNAQTPTELSKVDIDAAVLTLLGNDADMISEVVTGRDAFGTSPIRPAFMAYIDTDLLDDLESVSNFVNTSSYPQQGTVLDAEWGATGNVRWLYTSVGSVSSATIPVYNNFIVGKEAYALVHLRSETGDFYIEPLGSAGSADPLHQRGSVGWQHPFVARILNDAFMLNLMSTHS